MNRHISVLGAIGFLLLTVGCAKKTSDTALLPRKRLLHSRAPMPGRRAIRSNAYFGDMHLHSSYSMDAFALGTRTTPEDAYEYAMGETVEYFGHPQKRIAPLDFLALTDHAEYLGWRRKPSTRTAPSLRLSGTPR